MTKDVARFTKDSKLPFMINVQKKPVIVKACQILEPFEVETMEGVMKGKANDMLIQGIKGELYPCDLDVFLETYELHSNLKFTSKESNND